ncbi:S9 family peptidase [Bacteroidota bacterium]
MIKYFLLLVLSAVTLFPQEGKLTLEDLFLTNKYMAEEVENIQWLPDGSAFTYTKEDNYGLLDIYKYGIVSGESKLMLAASKLLYNSLPVHMSAYSWTADGRYLIIEGPEEEIWRHSRQAPFYLYEVETGNITALGNNDPGLRNVKLSPDGSKVGFVKDHNINVTDFASGEEINITSDGNKNILNGEFDWVYEEEFGLADGWRWSPDGEKIAFWRFDQTRVKEFYMIDEMEPYNKVTPLKYPKTGEENSIIKIGVYDLTDGSTSWMDIGEVTDIYIPRIYWTNSSNTLAILRLNRHQNYLEMLMSDVESGEGKVVLTDSDSCWVGIEERKAIFLNKENKFVWVSEMSGYRHAYLYDYDGNLINPITTGDWEVTSIEGVSESDGRLYFYGKKDTHLEQNVYRANLNSDNLHRITPELGWHTAEFSPNYKYFVNEFSSYNHPSKTFLRKTDGSLVSVLRENDLPALNEINFMDREFSIFETSDGVELNYYMIKPPDFDPSKKYSVLFYGYGGPGSQRVKYEWHKVRQLFHQAMAEKGYIVFCVDNRGTGGQGKSYKNLMYKDLGKWSVHDHIEAAKFVSSLPYVDSERIGFWGWSGGGYLCLMLMTRANEYFSTGVSVAPVSDFRLYDAIWSERYLGLLFENEAGYNASSVFSYSDNLGGKLLMIHGTGDDNVHYQNTLLIARDFQQKGKQFDLMLYPNKNHSIKGNKTQYHLYTKIMNYFLSNL